MKRVVFGWMLLASSGCDNASTTPAAPQNPSPPPASAAPTAASPATDSSIADTCELSREKYRDLLARGGACTKDEECAHYRGGYVGGNGGSPCGGITDATTAQALDKITRDLGSAHCQPLSSLCPHHVTIPKCALHKCL